MLGFLILTLIVGFIFYEMYWKRRHLPPGPIPLPLAGNIISVSVLHPPGYDAFINWKKEFGPVFTYWMGPFPTVIIADYETIKETIIKDGEKYTDRFTTEATHQIRGGDFGILETSGDNWREMRRFTLHTLRDFGMGKNLMEEKVMSEVTSLMDRFTLLKETAPQWEFDVAVGSIINNLLFGYRYEEDKQAEFRELKNLLSDHMKNIATFSVGMAFTQPWTRIIPMFNGL
ncbi:unnamed protein product, partial [Mesorhabditis belari]|uniref:Cytochrome P450 n=1 Tax=Mesorhabditis belari TaxID=2138241 RepID=A0AAF3EPZ7_9BILA